MVDYSDIYSKIFFHDEDCDFATYKSIPINVPPTHDMIKKLSDAEAKNGFYSEIRDICDRYNASVHFQSDETGTMKPYIEVRGTRLGIGDITSEVYTHKDYWATVKGKQLLIKGDMISSWHGAKFLPQEIAGKDAAKFTMEKFDKARRDRDITYFETKLAAETDIIEHMGCSMEFKE